MICILFGSVHASREAHVTVTFVNARPGGPSYDPVVIISFFGLFILKTRMAILYAQEELFL